MECNFLTLISSYYITPSNSTKHTFKTHTKPSFTMHRSCSCGYQYSNSFSMLLTVPYDQHICPYDSSSAVDCTLSLATPSTRLTSDEYYDSSEARFCWDFLQPDNPSRPPPSNKSIRAGVTNASAVDSLLARRCANCDTTSTPLWRNGPRGPKSLCNACGIRFKKEERRANAATAAAGGGLEVAATHKLPSCYSPGAVGGEFRFTDDVDDRDSAFMSWRLNVTDRAGLVHDFTRY